jgi:hypothetical protein
MEFNHSSSTGPGRKRKLDHLTPDEKVQRKKLKNRVAAQTSRDRKKKQMEEMQETIDAQNKRITILERRCDQNANEREKMRAKYDKLEKEYQKLDIEYQKLKNIKLSSSLAPSRHCIIPDEHTYTRPALEDTSNGNCVGSLPIKTEGSAVSHKPLLKVTKMEIESTKHSLKVSNKKKSEIKALLKVILLCLLYRNSSKTSKSMNSTWSNLQRLSSKVSAAEWKAMLNHARQQMPKAKAQNSRSLDQWWGPATQEWNPPKIAAY